MEEIKEEYHVNYFMQHIYNRKHEKFNFKEYREYKKFKKELKHTSPNFNMLIEIYYFLKILSQVYFFANSEKSDCIAYTSPNNKINILTFSIRRNDYVITYNLDQNTDKIEIIKSNNIKDAKSPASRVSFIDGNCVIENIDQENMMGTIINVTMDAVSELFTYYWKNKFRGY